MWGVRDKGDGRVGDALSMDEDDEANKPSPQVGTDANGGGHQQSDDRLALARRELAASNANAHGGRTMSLNDVTNEGGGGGGGFLHTTIHQKAAARAAAITAAIAAAIAVEMAVEMAAVANVDVGNQQRGRRQG